MRTRVGAIAVCLWLTGVTTGLCRGETPEKPSAGPLTSFRSRLPALERHWDGLTPADLQDQLDLAGHYRRQVREQEQGGWFAALVSREPGRRNAIEGRFETEQGWWDFLEEEEAVVDVWGHEVAEGSGAGSTVPRRLTAEDLAPWHRDPRVLPTEVTVTVRSRAGGAPVTFGVEFGFDAAVRSAERLERYQRDRAVRRRLHAVLQAKGPEGKIGALAQWLALREAATAGELPGLVLPPPPVSEADPYVAFEYAVDADGLLDRVVRVYRASGVHRRVENGVVRLGLSPPWGAGEVEALAYGRVGLSDRIEPVPAPLPGRDAVQLRVADARTDDPRRWNTVEFGAPEVIQQASLATFGLLNAHTDRQRKLRAWEKSRYDLFAEPIFAALNVASGATGAAVPMGEAMRIPYGLTLGRWFLPRSPTSKQLRELFLLLATHKSDPELRGRPANLLTREDFRRLRERMGSMTDEQAREVLAGIEEQDLKAMVALARFLRIDAEYRWFADLLTSVAKATGEADSGVLKTLFNSPYYSLAGEISLKNLLAAAVGAEEVIPGKTTSLKQLIEGDGPWEAWLQFFDVSVDVRAILNSVAQVSRRNLAERELERPFPHAPRMTDLAAYEVRIFGYPLLMYYKRGLLKDDIEAFDRDYAYGLLGTRIVEHFPTRESMEAEILSGRMFPLGYVKVRNASGQLKDSNLAVFAHRIPEGRHRGRLALVIYGLKAYEDYSAVIDRERRRFDDFLRALEAGAVVERVVLAGPGVPPPGEEREPRIHLGAEAQETRYAALLSKLLEAARLERLEAWGAPLTPADRERMASLRAELDRMGVMREAATGRIAVQVDRFGSTFRYRRAAGDGWQEIEVGLIPSQADLVRDATRAGEARRLAEARRSALAGRTAGVLLVHEAIGTGGGWRVGPVLRDAEGRVEGVGLRVLPAVGDAGPHPLARLSPIDRVRLEDNRYAATLVDGWERPSGGPGKVFVSVVFPAETPGGVPRVDPDTGEVSYRFYRGGLCEREASSRWVTVFERDEVGQEVAARTYVNRGSAALPVPGELIEEAFTLEQWLRGTSAEPFDPTRPRAVKVRFDHLTGEIQRQVYGAWPLPLAVSDERFVTTNRFNAQGAWAGAETFENGSVATDWARERFDALLHPRPGRPRGSVSPAPSTHSGPLVAVERRDLVTGLRRVEWLDRANGGRVMGAAFEDPATSGAALHLVVTNHYEDGFLAGRVPVRSVTREASTGTVLAETRTVSLEPLNRRRVATEWSPSGNTLTNTWEGGGEGPVRVESGGRRTDLSWDRDGLGYTGRVVDAGSDEELGVLAGRYDVAAGQWQERQTWWAAPGMTNRSEVVSRSPAGRWRATRLGTALESVPVLAPSGLPVEVHTYRLDPATLAREERVRQESELRHDGGYQEAVVETLVGGVVRDRYRVRRDPLGRVVRDGVREFPGLRLETSVEYVGASERWTEARELLNGALRARRTAGTPVARPEGGFWLPVTIQAAEGPTSTQWWTLGEGISLPIETWTAGGGRSRVMEWHPGTALARHTDVADGSGRWVERVRSLSDSVEVAGWPVDRVRRYSLSPWGTEDAPIEELYVRGTDLLVRRASEAEETVFELRGVEMQPRYVRDRTGTLGLRLRLEDGNVRSNVVGWVRSRPVAGGTQAPADAFRVVDRVDLRGFFRYPVSRQWLDAGGRVLEEWTGSVAAFGARSPQAELLETALTSFAPDQIHAFSYEPGVLAGAEGNASTGRQFTFVPGTNAPPGPASFVVNAQGRRDFVTRVETRAAGGSATAPATRRQSDPKLLEKQPHQPGAVGAWIAWTDVELDRQGNDWVESEVIRDGRGRVRSVRARKQANGGGVAIKMGYHLAASEEEGKRFALGRGRPAVLRDGTELDLGGADFVWCEVRGGTNTSYGVRFTDQRGRTVEAGGRGVPLWEAVPSQVLWLPNPVSPLYGAGVTVPPETQTGRRTLVVAVPALTAAGLNASRVAQVEVTSAVDGEETVEISPLRLLVGGAPAAGWEPLKAPLDGGWRLPGGLVAHQGQLPHRTAFDDERGIGRSVELGYGGVLLVTTRESRVDPVHPDLVILEPSADGVPEPRYLLSSRDGRLVEHYQVEALGGATRIYRIAQGFQAPTYEVHDHRVLADEVSPGFAAYGHNYRTSVRYDRSAGFLAERWATLRNRIAANAFAYYGSGLWNALAGGRERRGADTLSHANLHAAAHQAAAVAGLPTLAANLLPLRGLPWETPLPAGASLDAEQLRAHLAALRINLRTNHALLQRFSTNRTPYYPPTYLIPTAPGSLTERFVDTAEEAGVIELAVELGEFGLARDLLGFYAAKSDLGRRPLHASYDAETGTAMTKELGYRRPMQSRETAEAQVAVAAAAFLYAERSGDPEGRTLATNLVRLVLEGNPAGGVPAFRPGMRPGEGPRGVARFPVRETESILGLRLWPEPARYPVGVNARLLLLLHRMEAESTRLGETSWQQWLAGARTELEAWFRQHVLPVAESTGVVPAGVFEIQDVQGGATALGIDRWTSASDWLDLLDATGVLGVPEAAARAWLDHLVKVHGAAHEGVAGLDWSLPLSRQPALSVELTARLWRVARQLNHQAAADWAAANLARWPRLGAAGGGGFLSVWTAEPASHPLKTGQNRAVAPRPTGDWPESLRVHRELAALVDSGMRPSTNAAPARNARLADAGRAHGDRGDLTDLLVFVSIAAVFYASILVTAVGWWALRWARRRRPAQLLEERVVPDPVLQLAEERWAKRVLGVLTPAGAEHTRYSNSVLEPNFLMQLRALYKLVAEWRRVENGWDEHDRQIVEGESDDWLNGMDEYVCLVGIYMRFVIKAGAKDGLPRPDPVEEAEDSNHIWSRLVMFFSEYYWGLFGLMRDYGNVVTAEQRGKMYADIAHLLNDMGVRERKAGFDARRLLNHPTNPAAFDLLSVQKPGATLKKVLFEAATRLQVPYTHIVRIIERYKAFKRRESPDPVHPYLIEFAKCLPHFVLMGLGALVWYNQDTLGDSPLVPYLWSTAADLLQPAKSVGWALPLLGGMLLSLAAYFVRTYRFEGSMLHRDRPNLIVDATLTSLMGRKYSALPAARGEWWFDPRLYEWPGWLLRCAGFLSLAGSLLALETPSFATFLVVKGLFAMIALAEVGAVVLPLAMSWISRWLQDRVRLAASPSPILRFLNRLNLTATRPASPLWMSLRYHTQASVPSADARGMLQAIAFFFLMSATFFFTGGFLCQQIFPLWFTEMYLNDANGKLFLGSLVFWNTMYLLRYGLFLLYTSLASFACTFPFRAAAGAVALAYGAGLLAGSSTLVSALQIPTTWIPLTLLLAALVLLEEPLLARWRKRAARRANPDLTPETVGPALERIRANPAARLGVVYMSGDDLGFQKLTPDLLVTRWLLLRDRYDSEGLRLLARVAGEPSEARLREWFTELYELEKRGGVTLWHPSQLVMAGETPHFAADTGLNLEVADAAARARLVTAWHLRRWLVTMMSSAGHSQDTAITLVDMALRLHHDGLAGHTVFYLIQNKYDDRDDNRPSQLAYGAGELAQRNKLARLLEALAPGVKAWSVQNWTPFGFKAGGMTGMDLVHEEALRLSTMLVLDRNATVHDLDALMVDLARALEDPDLVILIPGRGTTNTLTDLGQASQLIEEGHRSFLKGLMSLLGGTASESVGTGWGNIVTCTYGRVQRAMMDPATPRMPLTSRMQRGANFAYKTEGLIGFTPHAVGISEDTWAVSQAAHNLVALGGRVKFGLSRAFWHKIRETWSHAEWLASFPRWSGGFLQMMHDPIMQRINDFGPLSVFAREIRAHSGRAFLSAPFALANVLLLPLAILFGVTPFIQILIILWNFGFVMNQVLTLHGLNVYLEGTGFRRLAGAAGALAGAALPAALGASPALAVLLAPLGALYGGFFVGFHRWLFTRFRDAILFGPQLVLHTLGQVMRQTIEFVASGAAATDPQGVNMNFRASAGPREDQPLNRFPHFINLRTVVWCVGLPSVLCLLLALSELDMFNVVLLLPSLLFSVSVLVGPYLTQPRPGGSSGAWTLLPRLAAWPAVLLLYGTVSLLVAHGGLATWIGLLLLAAGFAPVVRAPAAGLLFHSRLAAARRRLAALLAGRNLAAPQATALAADLTRVSGDAARLSQLLTKAGITEADHSGILEWITRHLHPLVQGPVRGARPDAGPRARVISDFSRSYVLALFVLLWFLVVPVPGLFVLSAGHYQASVLLQQLLVAVGALLLLAIPGYWVARAVLHQTVAPRGPGALVSRAEAACRRLQEQFPTLAPAESAERHALLMDLQTYIDQRSPAYADRVLRQLEGRDDSDRR